ncbi:MAG: pentapeptide repeat-containing protein [Spirulina sp. SIO3F2]|nr:pentapeptide repeat-containing protein [Spirulina sp. SIO3F2]
MSEEEPKVNQDFRGATTGGIIYNAEQINVFTPPMRGNRKHWEKLNEGVEAWNRWREENPGVSPDLQEANLQGADLKEANFTGANLEEANLQEANLQHANLWKAKLVAANLREANLRFVSLLEANLQQAVLLNAALLNAVLREANLTGANLQEANFAGANLHQANLRFTNLQRAILVESNLYEANLQQAHLVEANLTGANLFASQALFTNFSNTNLTGACIAKWGINEQTNFTDVQCDYIYLGEWKSSKKRYTNRRPHNPDEFFQPGDFARLMEQARNTVDLIFSNGIDWQAFLTSFQNLQVSGEHGDLSIQTISKKSDGSFVISVEAPEATDKAAIETDFKTKYESELKRLEGVYQERLQLKDEQIAFYKERNTDMTDIVKMLANRPINVESIAVAESNPESVNQQFSGPTYGVVGINKGNVNINQPQQNLTEAAAEIQALLRQLEETNPTTSTMEQMQVAMKAVQQIESDATLKEKVISAAKGGALEGLRATPIGAIVAGAIEGWTEA